MRFVTNGDRLTRLCGRNRCIALEQYYGSTGSFSLTADGPRLAMASGDSRLWNRIIGDCIAVLRRSRSRTVAFSSDGSRLASSADETVKSWDGRTGTHIAILNGIPNQSIF